MIIFIKFFLEGESMKLLLIFTTFLSFNSLAQSSCQVDLKRVETGIIIKSFQGDRCKKAFKQCSRLKRDIPGTFCERNHNAGTSNIMNRVLEMDIIERMDKRAYKNCYVELNVSNWANQIYVDGDFRGNFHKNNELGRFKRALKNYVDNGSCRLKSISELELLFSPRIDLLEKYTNYEIQGCYVLPYVSGWAHQIYVNGKFGGNFNISNSTELSGLKSRLASYIDTGACQFKSQRTIRLMNSPELVRDFVNRDYKGCHVKLNVSGWANQIYVNGVFGGNFHKSTEVQKLRSRLADLVETGKCIYDPIY